VHFPKEHETGGQGVHPTQLYEAGLNLILYLALEKLYRKKRFDGQVFGVYLVAYAVLRVVVELFRGDYGSHRVGVFTPGQIVSAVILAAGLAILGLQGRAARLKPQS
jgi:prolipoprotein diacylglyceryltransferase